MSELHADTRAAIVEVLRAEIKDDPAGRGYSGKTNGEVLALLNAPVPAAVPKPVLRKFKWGEARGIAQAHGCWPLIKVRSRGTPAIPPQSIEDGAILAAINAVDTERDQDIDATDPAVWGAFTGGIEAFLAVGDLTQQAADAILTLGTYQPPTPPDGQSRWVEVISGISAARTPPDVTKVDEETGKEVVVSRHPGYLGPPNAASYDLVDEAMADG